MRDAIERPTGGTAASSCPFRPARSCTPGAPVCPRRAEPFHRVLANRNKVDKVLST